MYRMYRAVLYSAVVSTELAAERHKLTNIVSLQHEHVVRDGSGGGGGPGVDKKRGGGYLVSHVLRGRLRTVLSAIKPCL